MLIPKVSIIRRFHYICIGPSILLVVEGEANMTSSEMSYSVRRGAVLFLPAGTKVLFSPLNNKQQILMYRAYCEVQK